MRAKEAIGLCTKKAVRDCRVAEIRQSLLNSQRLQEDYFVTHENDLLALRHDAKLKVTFFRYFEDTSISRINSNETYRVGLQLEI